MFMRGTFNLWDLLSSITESFFKDRCDQIVCRDIIIGEDHGIPFLQVLLQPVLQA